VSQTTVSNRLPRFKVKTLTGGEIQLLHANEKKYYELARDKYLSEYEFTAANDKRTLDRLLLLEVQMHRAQWMLMAGMDYEGIDLDGKEETELRRAVKDIGAQINETQTALGLAKSQRDKAQHDSVGAYITNLKNAAKLHGVKREKELGKAIEMTKELFAICGRYERSNEEERRKSGVENADVIVAWVLEYMKPEFDSIDAYFREHEQKFWVRSL
jgi:hypothetical protein